MLRYVYDQDLPVGRFVAELIPHVGYRGFSSYRAMGIVDNDGRLIAGVVYERWNTMAGTIEMSAAALPGTHWFTRETIRRAFAYAFENHGCQMMVMRVLAKNLHLLHQLENFGFALTTIRRMYGPHDDGVMCTYTREDWAASRFNPVKPNVVELRRTAA